MNIVYSRNYDYQLGEYEQQIRRNRSRLFGNENFVILERNLKTKVSFIVACDLPNVISRPVAKSWTSKHDLAAAGVRCGSSKPDPLCRFM